MEKTKPNTNQSLGRDVPYFDKLSNRHVCTLVIGKQRTKDERQRTKIDAIAQGYIRLSANGKHKWVLDADIKGFFDNEEINYQGASGDIEFDRYGDTVGSYDVWQVKNQGEIDIIDRVTLSRD
ncbi:hypothetical protein [Dactylococcopsis salina]|uniref:hypothetical protein n=1 Tax=Dactylococcopsis salina TaxID=292566 RepID=UPI00059BAE40|nr:hypothetical protein [Dactylococcopsis salina]